MIIDDLPDIPNKLVIDLTPYEILEYYLLFGSLLSLRTIRTNAIINNCLVRTKPGSHYDILEKIKGIISKLEYTDTDCLVPNYNTNWSNVPGPIHMINRYPATSIRKRDNECYLIAELFYIITYRPININHKLIRQCANRVCCNPQHIKTGTRSETMKYVRSKIGWNKYGRTLLQ